MKCQTYFSKGAAAAGPWALFTLGLNQVWLEQREASITILIGYLNFQAWFIDKL